MILPSQMEKLFDLNDLAKADAAKFPKKRFLYSEVKRLLGSRVFIGIAGLRGSGKSILLRQLAAELPDSAYISLDTLETRLDLFELAGQLSKNHRIAYLLLDEIHSYPGWQKNIKKIYDFLDIHVVFTSSVSIEILQSRYDLSRRVVVLQMPPFSFREYLYFKKQLEIEPVGLDAILETPGELYGRLRLHLHEPDFMEFCMRGALPAYLDAPLPQTIRNILEKILNEDLLTFGKLGKEDIINIRNLLRFISRSSSDVCSYTSIASNIAVSRYKVQEYIRLLEEAFVLKVILPYGSNVTKEPKIVYTLPLRFYLAQGVDEQRLTGALREEFFIHHTHAFDINYLKGMRGEKLADYLLFHEGAKIVFEIGGAGKTNRQLKGLPHKKRFVLSQPGNLENGIPLVLFGLLW